MYVYICVQVMHFLLLFHVCPVPDEHLVDEVEDEEEQMTKRTKTNSHHRYAEFVSILLSPSSLPPPLPPHIPSSLLHPSLLTSSLPPTLSLSPSHKSHSPTTRTPLLTLQGHTQPASTVIWPQEEEILSAGMDHCIRMWDMPSGVNKSTLVSVVQTEHLNQNPVYIRLVDISFLPHPSCVLSLIPSSSFRLCLPLFFYNMFFSKPSTLMWSRAFWQAVVVKECLKLSA